jgi:methylenetetrahydrofolate dehydrogenase (NADP+) / methenyltetrahydrofolate cyclohydrolase
MTARLLDGQALAATIQQGLVPDVDAFRRAHGRPPALGILLVGNDPASEVYVRNKVRSGRDAGLLVDMQRLPDSATLVETLAAVRAWNANDCIDGILVQSPLPAAMGHDAEQQVIDAIAPAKDVDGFGVASVGMLVQNRPTLVACTPSGVIELLDHEGLDIRGRHAVVIGRSDIVGKPMALLLLHRDATVTICHSRTRNLAEECRRADILVAAVGRPGLVRADFVKPGATVIDVGINRVDDPAIAASLFADGHPRLEVFRKKGAVLVGDVHPEVEQIAGALTPVPGGVGPLTIAMLMKNTVKAAQLRVGQQVAGGR